MRTVALNRREMSAHQPDRLARLTRHLQARLMDLGEETPEVTADQGGGTVLARFPHRDSEWVARRLGELGVDVLPTAEGVLFQIPETLPFEDLDYVWGCLFQVLSE